MFDQSLTLEWSLEAAKGKVYICDIYYIEREFDYTLILPLDRFSTDSKMIGEICQQQHWSYG